MQRSLKGKTQRNLGENVFRSLFLQHFQNRKSQKCHQKFRPLHQVESQKNSSEFIFSSDLKKKIQGKFSEVRFEIFQTQKKQSLKFGFCNIFER